MDGIVQEELLHLRQSVIRYVEMEYRLDKKNVMMEI